MFDNGYIFDGVTREYPYLNVDYYLESYDENTKKFYRRGRLEIPFDIETVRSQFGSGRYLIRPYDRIKKKYLPRNYFSLGEMRNDFS